MRLLVPQHRRLQGPGSRGRRSRAGRRTRRSSPGRPPAARAAKDAISVADVRGDTPARAISGEHPDGAETCHQRERERARPLRRDRTSQEDARPASGNGEPKTRSIHRHRPDRGERSIRSRSSTRKSTAAVTNVVTKMSSIAIRLCTMWRPSRASSSAAHPAHQTDRQSRSASEVEQRDARDAEERRRDAPADRSLTERPDAQ